MRDLGLVVADALVVEHRDMRSCCATSQTIVRLPRRAAATPSAAATVDLPTPPLPVTKIEALFEDHGGQCAGARQ